MKNLMILTITLFGFVACNSPKQKKIERTEIDLHSFSIVPNWTNEAIINLELKKTRTVKRNGMTQSGSSTANIELIISENNDNTWNGKWSIIDIKTPSIKNPIDKKIESLSKGFVYNFTIDSLGTIKELLNWREIQMKGFEALDIMIDEIKKLPSMNPQITIEMEMNISDMFNSKEKIETFLMQEVQLYFALGGIEMTKADTIRRLIYINHPLTGSLIGQNIVAIYKKAYSDSTCDIQLIETIAESELYETVLSLIDKVGGQEKKDIFHKEMSNTKFDLKIISDYNISLITGLVEKVTAQKEIIIGDAQMIDKIELIRK